MQVLYNKNYHGEEDQVRKTIFEERLNRIVQHNLEYDLGIHSYYRGINEFSDMTRQERLKYKKGLIPSDIKEERNLYEYSGDIELPASLDWRTKGYVTENGPCGFNNATIGATCKNYKIIAKNENILQEALVKIGPISIGINCLDSFMDYKGGVYNDPECEPITLDHAMLLVGYGTDNGKDYWLVKN
ncbi:hypothetical protein LAZ67_1002847, partial [Cordylochernes scorpioides]